MVSTMQDDLKTGPGWTLQAELEASGAKPHSRMSDLSRYMLAHYDEIHALITVQGYGWAAIADVLASTGGFTDKAGKPVTDKVAKLTWSRTNQRRRAATTPNPARHVVLAERAMPPLPPAAALDLPATEPHQQNHRSQNLDISIADDDALRMVIRPARPRGAVPLPSMGENKAESTVSLLSEDELDRRLAELAGRQGGHKLPPPEVL